MEHFYGYDFDTMRDTTDSRAEPIDLGGVSFMRGVLYGFAFALPAWLLIGAAVVALV